MDLGRNILNPYGWFMTHNFTKNIGFIYPNYIPMD